MKLIVEIYSGENFAGMKTENSSGKKTERWNQSAKTKQKQSCFPFMELITSIGETRNEKHI